MQPEPGVSSFQTLLSKFRAFPRLCLPQRFAPARYYCWTSSPLPSMLRASLPAAVARTPPPTTALPQTTLQPSSELSPQTTELPQITELPARSALPQTTELPQITELLQTEDASATR